MDKQITLSKALECIKDGMTLMIGGFLATGGPNKLIDALLNTDVRDLTIICNDTGFPDKGLGKLIVAKRVKKVIVSHVGTNPETGNQYKSGELEIEFNPQGTLAERIRCGGSGLGGVLTAVGMGTVIQEGKQIVKVGGKDYLLETPLRADVALLKAALADEFGNLIYKGTAQNFNPVMATAADLVIAEVEDILPLGSMTPETVHTPGIYVDYIIKL